MNKYRKTFLRNEEGASPGGGSPTPPPAPPTAPPPGGNGNGSSSVSIDDIKGVVGSMLGELRNGIFADLRKAGALKQDKTNETPPQPAPSPATPASALESLSKVDVERMLDVRSASERMRHERKATDAQLRHFQRAVEFEKPTDVFAFASSYFDDLGIGKAAPAPVNPLPSNPAPQLPGTPPAPLADRGPPSPAPNRDVDAILEANPLSLTQHDIARLKAKHGEAKAREMIARHVNEALAGKKAVPR